MNNIASVCTYIFCKGDDGEFYTLVGKRTSTSPSGANRYTPPMGMVEDGENPYNAAVRECMEETGVRLPKHKIVYYDEETYPMQGKQYTGANFYAFLDGTISNYPIGEGDGENEKFIWLPLSKIKTIPWAFGTGNKMREIMNKLKIDMAKNTIRLTESELKRVISESVKRVLKEGIKAADAMNATSPELAKECGFEPEYENVDGGFQLWGGPLPEDKQEKMLLLRKLGIKRFTSENHMNGTCRITVDPSGKIANIGKHKAKPLNSNEMKQLAISLKQARISGDKAVQMLVARGYNEEKARAWVSKYDSGYSLNNDEF